MLDQQFLIVWPGPHTPLQHCTCGRCVDMYMPSEFFHRYDGYHTFTDLVRLVESKARIDQRKFSSRQPVIQLDDTNFERIVKDPSKDVMVYFYTVWCIKCKNLTEVVAKVADNFKVAKIIRCIEFLKAIIKAPLTLWPQLHYAGMHRGAMNFVSDRAFSYTMTTQSDI